MALSTHRNTLSGMPPISKQRKGSRRGRLVRRPTFLREWRKFAGMTLEEAAPAAGMSAGNLSAMERGEQGYTQPGLEALAEVYGTEPGWLLNVDPRIGGVWPLWQQATPEDRVRILAAMKAFLNLPTQ